jgi:hypothetical protein
MTGFIIVLVLIGAVIVFVVGVFIMEMFAGIIVGIPLFLIGLWALTSWGDYAGLGIVPLIVGGLFIWGNISGGFNG